MPNENNIPDNRGIYTPKEKGNNIIQGLKSNPSERMLKFYKNEFREYHTFENPDASRLLYSKVPNKTIDAIITLAMNLIQGNNDRLVEVYNDNILTGLYGTTIDGKKKNLF